MRSLSARLLALLTIALLPLGAIAVYQTLKVVSEAQLIAENEILANTVQAARAEIGLIRRAHGIAYALGTAAAATAADEDGCKAIMRRFVEQDATFVFAGFIPLSGVMTCSSSDRVVDFSEFPAWQTFLDRPSRTVTFEDRGAVSGETVLIASSPIYSESGALLGAGSVSIPHSVAEEYLENDVQNLDVAIIDTEGKVITASSTGVDKTISIEAMGILPADMTIPINGTTFRRFVDGEEVAVAIVPVVPQESYLVGRWTDTPEPFSVSLLGTATPLFPVIMWVMSLFVAFFAIDRLVLQYLSKMRVRMALFSPDTPENGYLQLENAPAEIAEIASSYNLMIERVASKTEDLEKSVLEKDILLKEIHHRVKNNLQLIASILNMQLRQIDAPEAVSVLRRVQDRVMSLATIHKSLYTDTSVDTVRIDRLLKEIISATLNVSSTPGRHMKMDVTLDPIELDPDQAVPLSLLVTEAVTNAVKYVGDAEGQQPKLGISLTETKPSTIHLIVENSRGTNLVASANSTGLGARLIEAFVQQLGGNLEVTETDATYKIDVQFTKRSEDSGSGEAA